MKATTLQRANKNRFLLLGRNALTLLFFVLFALAFGPSFLSAAETYSFDLSEIEKKPYHFGGYLEAKPLLSFYNKDSAVYRFRFTDQDLGHTLEEANFKLQLEGSYDKGIARLYFKTNTDYRLSRLGDKENTDLYEGYLSLNPVTFWQIDAGKKTFKWGKGYAWNPVAFIDRPKDPDDPDVGMEGIFALSSEFTKSFAGPLKTLSFTPVLQPVYEHINEEFGKKDYVNLASKLYLLLYDTDIDFMVFTGGSRTTRFGSDFSRNVTTNWEIHGEIAYFKDIQANLVDRSGTVTPVEFNATSYLLGTRYLTAQDTTYILEYYRNGTGYTEGQMASFYGFAHESYRTYQTTGSDTNLKKAARLFEGQYGRPNPMRDYLYMRVSHKEPFDLLYVTPAITTIFNLNDQSFSLSPEISYTGITNLTLRLKAMFITGATESEYGEKPYDFKLELRAGYYF
ncbi:MAG: hypothetical protein JXB42_04980 [Deltaproteobacteria bacterium]|nr:hypothetical protein [Deltaproteobacteria bacterium]